MGTPLEAWQREARRYAGACKSYEKELAKLRAQLAAVTADRDRLRRALEDIAENGSNLLGDRNIARAALAAPATDTEIVDVLRHQGWHVEICNEAWSKGGGRDRLKAELASPPPPLEWSSEPPKAAGLYMRLRRDFALPHDEHVRSEEVGKPWVASWWFGPLPPWPLGPIPEPTAKDGAE